MITRYLTIVKNDGKYMVTQYGQWDGHPMGDMVIAYNFVKNKNNIEMLRKNINKCIYITKDEYKQLKIDFNKDKTLNNFFKIYPQFDKATGVEILSFIAKNLKESIKLFNSIKFVASNLFCEWAYVIDLDRDVFEVLECYNKKELVEEDSFFDFENNLSDSFHPCYRVIEWKFDDLSETVDDFLKHFDFN